MEDIDIFEENGRTPLHSAAGNGNAELVRRLLVNGANPNAKNKDGGTPLHDAARLGANADTISALLEAGADIDARDNFGNTPLHAAAIIGRAIAARTLLGAGATPNLPNAHGQTAQFYAMYTANGAMEIVAAIEAAQGGGKKFQNALKIFRRNIRI